MRSRRSRRRLAVLLATLAIAAVAAPPAATGLGAGDATTAECRALSVTDATGCENWVQDWTGPEEHEMYPTATAVAEDEGILVEAGISFFSLPFGRVGVIARDTATGDPVWESGWIDPHPFQVEMVSDAAIGPRGDHIYVAGETVNKVDGFVVALNLDSGDVAWTNRPAESATTLAVGEERIFVGGSLAIGGSVTGGVWALEPGTGDRLWSQSLQGEPDDIVKLADGPLVSEERAPRLQALDASTGEPAWTAPLTAPGGVETTVIEMAASPDGSHLATIEAYPCEPYVGAPLVRVLDAGGTEAWAHLDGCVDRGTATSPVFTGEGRVVVPVAYVPRLVGTTPSETATMAPALKVTSYDVSTGTEAWTQDHTAPPTREILAGEATLSPDGERIYVGGSLTSSRGTPGDDPVEDSYALARSYGCLADAQIPSDIPREGLLQGYPDAVDCQRRPGWASFVAAFEIGSGDRLGRLVHEGPFHVEGEALAVDTASGDVLVTGAARDATAEPRFRTVSWPADAWPPIEPQTQPVPAPG